MSGDVKKPAPPTIPELDINLEVPPSPEIIRQAKRYRFLRKLSSETGALEAFVAAQQLDRQTTPEAFDKRIDDEIKKAKT